MYPQVSMIILNWNRWKDTIECLESIYQTIYPDYNVVVIDNGSDDESVKRIKEYCEGKIKVKSDFFQEDNKPIKVFEFSEEELESKTSINNEYSDLNSKLILIKNHKNYGFAEGNNIGMRFALKNLNPDYMLLLNNDTVVDGAFLNELVNLAQEDEEIGVVGPKIYYYNHKGRKDVINYAGETINFYTSRGKRFGRFERDKGQYDKIRQVDKIDGSCMLIKKEIIERVGMFDPVYFAYWEEADLCIRIKNAGFKLIYAPKARIWHKIGVTWDTYFSYFIIYHYLVRNRLIFMQRYATSFQKIVFRCFYVVYLIFNIFLMFIKEDLDTSKEGLRAIKNGLNDFYKLKKNVENN